METMKRLGGLAAAFLLAAPLILAHPPAAPHPGEPISTKTAVYRSNWSKHMERKEEDRELDPEKKEPTYILVTKEFVIDLQIEHDDKQAA